MVVLLSICTLTDRPYLGRERRTILLSRVFQRPIRINLILGLYFLTL
jgi:hypothetical protein